MAITGNLKTMDLPELLQWLSQGRKTGILNIDSGVVKKKIFFDRGKIISTSSSDPKEYLGHFLVSQGFIDELMLAKAMEMQAENNMLLGKILLTIGAISEGDLENMLQLKAEESIFEIFTWSEGDFDFIDQEAPSVQMVPIALDVTHLVLKGLERFDQWQRIQQVIPDGRCIPVSVCELVAAADDPGAANVLSLVNDDRTVEEIAIQTHSSEFFVCMQLFNQMQAGALKIVRPRWALTGDDASGKVESEPNLLIRRAEDFVEMRDLERALRHIRAARSLDPDNRAVREGAERVEERIKEVLETDGIAVEAIPRLTKPIEELSILDLSAQEGFILTRINGSYDIQTILKISPMPALEARLLFWKLAEAELIQLDLKS